MTLKPRIGKIVLLIGLFAMIFLVGCEKKDLFIQGGDEEFKEEVKDVEDDDEKDICVETSFLNLYYPVKWKNYIRIEQNMENEVTGSVSFLGKVSDKEEQLLFVIYFNEDGEIPIGIIEKSEENIYVNLTISELELSDLSQEEIDKFSEMQECVNDLLNQIHQVEGFKEI